MRYMRKLHQRMLSGCLAGLALVALAQSIASAGTAEGTITSFYQRSSDGLVILYLAGATTGRPTCASATTYWMVKDENSNVGRGHFATLLAAQIAGKRVRITGTNTCTRWGDGEDIQYVQILD